MLPFPLTQRLSLTVKLRKRGEGQLAANFEANIWRCTCFLLALFPRGRGRMRGIRVRGLCNNSYASQLLTVSSWPEHAS